jgi:DNA-binding XRE family transcriptional regulator
MQAIAYLKGGERYVVRAQLTTNLLKAHFADGYVAKIPLRAIPDLPGEVTTVSVPGPTCVLVHCGKTKKVELPWDWLRGYGDTAFQAAAQSRKRESALSVGQRIATKRHQLNWSQQELAAKCHVDRSTIARAETGEQMPAYATLVALSKAFGCTLADMLL